MIDMFKKTGDCGLDQERGLEKSRHTALAADPDRFHPMAFSRRKKKGVADQKTFHQERRRVLLQPIPLP